MPRILAAVFALLLAASMPALADQNKNKGKSGQAGSEDTTTEIIEGVVGVVAGAVLSDDEKQTIRDYYHKHPETAGKVKPLPPGIRKKLARGGTLPPGIAKQALPDGLHRQLPPRDGQSYEVIGSDVVLVETATQVIVDVLKDVLRGG